jgi:hypothetical protein
MIIIIIIFCLLKILRVRVITDNSNSKIFKKHSKFQIRNKDLFQLLIKFKETEI